MFLHLDHNGIRAVEQLLAVILCVIEYVQNMQNTWKGETSMPVATAVLVPERFDLKSLPSKGEEEGGWVELRRMTYGESIHRRDIAMAMSMKAEQRNPRDAEMKITQAQTVVAQYELKLCVTGHNLTHPDGRPVDFRKPEDVHMLDPRVGDEISLLIGKMNTFEEQLPNSENKSGT